MSRLYYDFRTSNDIDREVEEQAIRDAGAKRERYNDLLWMQQQQIKNRRREEKIAEKKAELEAYMNASEEKRALFSLFSEKTNPDNISFTKWCIATNYGLSNPLSESQKRELRDERMQWAKGNSVQAFINSDEVCYYTYLKRLQKTEAKIEIPKVEQHVPTYSTSQRQESKQATYQPRTTKTEEFNNPVLECIGIVIIAALIGLVVYGIANLIPVIMRFFSVFASVGAMISNSPIIVLLLVVIAVIAIILVISMSV